jgi:mannose-1-phosphate guanylyltransferase/mannose-1-phosphate guanylyltransferase/mannose-6-phosphate isomerase
MSEKIYPVLLSGGAGASLWPLSRESYPKQFLPIFGNRTLLQAAALRLSDTAHFEPLTIVANAEHRFIVAQQLAETGIAAPTILLEPAPRNTAAAIAAAALHIARHDPDAILLASPVDHIIEDVAAFTATVAAGLDAARSGTMVLFGVAPTGPETRYGYIRTGRPVADGVFELEDFVEKPDEAAAQSLLSEGGRLWNSGMFLLPAQTVLSAFAELQPALLSAVREAVDGGVTDLDFLRLDAEAFARSPAVSFDSGVVAHTRSAAVVPIGFAWSDVDAWSDVWDLGPRDADANVCSGPVVADHTRNSHLHSEGPLVAAVGVEGVIVVAAKDAVLVTTRDKAHEVGGLLDRLRAQYHTAATEHPRVYRPWGWYESIDDGDRYQVKHIMVRPGARLSLQKHFHRAEHWVVVSGTAEVEVEQTKRLLSENESIYVPVGAVHRLSNPGKVSLNLIEVQSGAYLGEDDIVRLEDVYARR